VRYSADASATRSWLWLVLTAVVSDHLPRTIKSSNEIRSGKLTSTSGLV
jgi:hypothetical protein